MKSIFLFTFIFCLFTMSVFSQNEGARKIGEFANINCDDYLGRMDFAIGVAQNNPSAKIYFLIYEGKEKRYNSRKKQIELVNPPFGSAKAKINSIKKWLSLRKAPIDRFVFVEAGFREELTVEIWLVPNGVESPKSTPTLEKIRYQKGKPSGFCVGCCG